jgi:hypothetical protein
MDSTNDCISTHQWATRQLHQHQHPVYQILNGFVLNDNELNRVKSAAYVPKLSKETGFNMNDLSWCKGWYFNYIMRENVMVLDSELMFLYQHFIRIYPNTVDRIKSFAVARLSPNGFIGPHSDVDGKNNVHYELYIPLYVLDGAGIGFENCGILTLPQYSVNALDIKEVHAVWNLSHEYRYVLMLTFNDRDTSPPNLV